jgi:ParB-like nuclease domain
MSILAGEKFDLKLIRSAELLRHEDHEQNRTSALVERLNDEKVLYNPLIVGKYEDKYVLIDGANRFEALKEIGCKTILAQTVDYASTNVVLKSWYHYVNGITMKLLIDYLLSRDIDFEKWNIKDNPLKMFCAGVISDSGEAILIRFRNDLFGMLDSICSISRYYEEKYAYMRIDSDTDISNVAELSNEAGLLFIYPQFSKEDIVNIALSNKKLPAGISRHLIPNRVLHIKILVEALKTDEHLDKRNEDLENFIQYKIDTKKVRLYREPILVFDE